MTSPAESHETPARRAVGAVRNLVLAAAVLGGLFFAYSKYVANSKVIFEHDKKAKDLIQRDNPAEYRAALDELQKSLAVRSSDPYAVSAGAASAAVLWAEYGDDSFQKLATDLDAKADALKLNTKERYLADGLVKVANGKLDEAEKELLQLANKGVTPAEVLEPLGVIHGLQGKLDQSKLDFKQAADHEFRGARYLSFYGDSFFDAGDFASAAATYQKALDTNPVHVRSLIGRARAFVAQDSQVDEATQTIDDLLAKGPDEVPPVMKARALAAKAEALLASNDAAGAEEAATKAIAAEVKSDPARAYAHYDLGLALAAQKKDGALKAIQDAIAAYPPVARFYFQGALALAKAGDQQDGQALLDQYAKSFKKDDRFEIARGDFFQAMGQLDQALEAYQAATTQNNVNPEAWYKQGYVLQEQGLKAKNPKAKKAVYDKAIEAYEKAVQIRDSYAEVYRQMGLIYLDFNPRSPDALDAFGKALKYFKEQKAAKATVADFIDTVEAKYKKAHLAANATAWRKEATEMMR